MKLFVVLLLAFAGLAASALTWPEETPSRSEAEWSPEATQMLRRQLALRKKLNECKVRLEQGVPLRDVVEETQRHCDVFFPDYLDSLYHDAQASDLYDAIARNLISHFTLTNEDEPSEKVDATRRRLERELAEWKERTIRHL